MYTKDTRKISIKTRLSLLESNGKNVDSPGVINKLRRQARQFEEKEK